MKETISNDDASIYLNIISNSIFGRDINLLYRNEIGVIYLSLIERLRCGEIREDEYDFLCNLLQGIKRGFKLE